MMRILLFLPALCLSCVATVSADENVRAAQERLKDCSLYFGEANGAYDSETAAALTRFQIRNGLQISGQLDTATSEALGVTPAETDASPARPESEAWRRLRKSDEQFLERLNSGEIPPPKVPDSDAGGPPSPATVDVSQGDIQGPETAATSPAPSAPAASVPHVGANGSTRAFGRERLRDYVGAFVLAGLDPRIGAELEFFGARVDYFGERNVSREKIRHDLLRYDRRWPERRFWLDGELEVRPQVDGRLKVTFPLRFELRNGKARSSGKVRKSIVLERAGEDLQIIAVDERKSI